MHSCKRPFPFLQNDELMSLSDYSFQVRSAKRVCREARYSPSKYAVQMEIREVGHESESQTEMETEPSLINSFPATGTLDASRCQNSSQLSHQTTNITSNIDCNKTHCSPADMNNSSVFYNNNNNNNSVVNRYITRGEICVRCQAGEAGHYGHIGR